MREMLRVKKKKCKNTRGLYGKCRLLNFYNANLKVLNTH